MKHNVIRAVTLAVFLSLSALASASTSTITPGQQNTVFDPNGSGRSASYALVSGSESWAFSTGRFDGVDVNTVGGLIGALNVSNLRVEPLSPAWMDPTLQATLDGVRTAAAVNASVASVVVDNATGQIRQFGAAGGVVISGSFISGTLTGGSASVSNLRFDLSAGTVTADLYGVKQGYGAPSVIYDRPNTVLWTFDTSMVSGPTFLKPEYLLAADPVAALTAVGFEVQHQDGKYQLVAENKILNLLATTAGYNFFRDSLGLLTTGQNALKAVNNDLIDEDGHYAGQGGYGSVTSRLVFEVSELTPFIPEPIPPVPPIASLPEPSAYALMGLGLVGVILASRRAKRH